MVADIIWQALYQLCLRNRQSQWHSFNKYENKRRNTDGN